MFETLKNKLAEYVVSNKIKQHKNGKQHLFNGFFKKSFTFLVLMPEEESDFSKAFMVLDFLSKNKKHSTILTYDYRVNLISPKYRAGVIEHGINDLNKIDLPSKGFINKLTKMNFQAVIDLNRKENLLYSFISKLVIANIRIGFSNPSADKFYNLQIANNKENPEESYKNLINCLEMF